MPEDESASPTKRIRLTRTQLQTAAGKALLNLCEKVTGTGSVLDDGLEELSVWLREHANSDLPAVEFLRQAAERACGRDVSPESRRDLYEIILKILPPEARAKAAERRRLADGDPAAWRRAERQTHRRREELRRNEIITSANFLIAGVNHQGRAAVIARYAQPGDAVFLERDAANAYSRNAIKVRLSNGLLIGYVPENYRPENYAARLAPWLDSGCRHTAEITRILDQGRPPIPVVDVRIYRNVATVRGAVTQKDVLEKFHAISGGCSPVEREAASHDIIVWIFALLAALAAVLFVFRVMP